MAQDTTPSFYPKVKCPQCVKEGLKSIVYVGASSRTLMCIQEWYDEYGNYHYYDPNTTTTNYTCSNGHSWSMKSK